MTDTPVVVGLAGSLSSESRSTALVTRVLRELEAFGVTSEFINLADLPADALLARSRDAALNRALQTTTSARVLVVGTPIYRASYTGQLKAFFDLLPRDALANTAVGLIATGAGRDHRLAVDHALRPLVASLAGLSASRAIYASDAELDANPQDVQQQVTALARELLGLIRAD
ncbi:MAG: NAD(P)H-dependent oxidoreductase [Chloroflexi bacterium]|nr:NAD(P)H-dependent oxidoreductase [Chloroflexota bacterium]MBV9897249.1 NAD(P)H-dependent oxidoreductase [Chloroflexota bacterium]